VKNVSGLTDCLYLFHSRINRLSSCKWCRCNSRSGISE